MKPILSRLTLVSSSSDMSPSAAPSIRTSPADGRSRPPIRLRSVDLPDPEGPTIDTSSPLGIERVTSARAVTWRLPSNRLVMRSRAIIGGSGVLSSELSQTRLAELCEKFHKLVKGWLIRLLARAYTCEEDLLTELMSRRKRPTRTARRWTRMDLSRVRRLDCFCCGGGRRSLL